MRLVHFGTFDVENYGDLLFPLIARHRLGELGADMRFASPVGGPPVWDDCVPTLRVSAVADEEVDGLLLGGGNIVHAAQAGVDAYRESGTTALLAYTRLWLTPSEIANACGAPLCWNAPGVPHAMSPRAADVLRWATAKAQYLSVRDQTSLQNMRHARVPEPVEVVPDSALDVAELWSQPELSEAVDDIFQAAGRKRPSRLLAIHLNDRYIEGSAESLAERLDRMAERVDAIPVLLALGPCHGDDRLARDVGARMRSEPMVVDRPASLRQLVAAIAHAEVYLGSSMHGMVTALAFGRPAVQVAREAPQGGKFSGFLGQFQLGHRLSSGWNDAEKRLDELFETGAPDASRVARAAKPLLDSHWARIADVMQSGLTGRRPRAKPRRPPSVEGILEEGVDALLASSREQRRRADNQAARADDTALKLVKGAADHEPARLEVLEPQLEEVRAQRDDTGRRLAERGALIRRLSDALEHARTEQDAAEERLRSAEAEVADADRAGDELKAELEQMLGEMEELRSAREASLGRERALRDQLIQERDGLEERLEATLAALNEARMASTPRVEVEALEAEQDRLRAQLLTESAARQGLEEHLAALRQEITERVRPVERVAGEPTDPGRDFAPSSRPDLVIDPTDAESVARGVFYARYVQLCRDGGLDQLPEADRARPWPTFPPVPAGAWEPHGSLVVCVHNALDDVRRCLESVARHLTVDAEIVLVDDGSDSETARFLEAIAGASRRVRLIANREPPHGYTIAANLGLRAARGDYLVLLNSDTIVTAGWFERLMACAESRSNTGIVGPVSNAASHQSVPRIREDGQWGTNPLPEWLTVEGMGVAVASASPLERPRVPFVNGYCQMVTRRTLDAVGFLDEQNFAEGYCEENDYAMRARSKGLSGAIADDAFVFHAKSRSYTQEGRSERARRNYERFMEKHGADTIQPLVDSMESSPPLQGLRNRLEPLLDNQLTLVREVQEHLGDHLRPLFVLTGVPEGGSGGSHSIVQEAAGLGRLGVPARVSLPDEAIKRARAAYPGDEDLFVAYRGTKSLAELAADANVIIATHSDSVPLVKSVIAAHPGALPAYYVQDYEPFFWEEGSENARRALASYTALDGACVFTKTDWLRNLVSAAHGVRVHKVEPSIDRSIYWPAEEPREESARVVIAAMVRPRTPRRQPQATVRLLERLIDAYGDGVEVVTFGCAPSALERLTDMPGLRAGHRGVLSRADVAELLRGADVFVDHSTYQAFGRTALEAMACGCVPVVPAIGGAWEFAEPDVNALVCDTLDDSSLYAAAARLVEDVALRKRLRDSGLGTVDRYSVERAAMSEFALFASLLLLRQGTGDAKGLAARAS